MGPSEAPEGGYSMNAYADDLVGLLDALEVERTVLCGLSMGGYVAFEVLRGIASAWRRSSSSTHARKPTRRSGRRAETR
jgi:surfactin synthase thioesterase subunit